MQIFAPVLGEVFPSISAFSDTGTRIKRSTNAEFGLGSGRISHPNFRVAKLTLPPTFGSTSANVGLRQPTWGASKSGWRSSGSALPLLRDASESLISEDGRLLDVNRRPMVSWVLLHNNHWLGKNGASQGITHHL